MLNGFMLNVLMLNVLMLNVLMLSVVRSSVIMLDVMNGFSSQLQFVLQNVKSVKRVVDQMSFHPKVSLCVLSTNCLSDKWFSDKSCGAVIWMFHLENIRHVKFEAP